MYGCSVARCVRPVTSQLLLFGNINLRNFNLKPLSRKSSRPRNICGVTTIQEDLALRQLSTSVKYRASHCDMLTSVDDTREQRTKTCTIPPGQLVHRPASRTSTPGRKEAGCPTGYIRQNNVDINLQIWMPGRSAVRQIKDQR